VRAYLSIRAASRRAQRRRSTSPRRPGPTRQRAFAAAFEPSAARRRRQGGHARPDRQEGRRPVRRRDLARGALAQPRRAPRAAELPEDMTPALRAPAPAAPRPRRRRQPRVHGQSAGGRPVDPSELLRTPQWRNSLPGLPRSTLSSTPTPATRCCAAGRTAYALTSGAILKDLGYEVETRASTRCSSGCGRPVAADEDVKGALGELPPFDGGRLLPVNVRGICGTRWINWRRRRRRRRRRKARGRAGGDPELPAGPGPAGPGVAAGDGSGKYLERLDEAMTFLSGSGPGSARIISPRSAATALALMYHWLRQGADITTPGSLSKAKPSPASSAATSPATK
jgi:hypothetical protein